MRLLDARSQQPFNSDADSLLNCLQEISDNVRIKSQFCIDHPNYQPFELPVEAIERFQSVPTELQEKYLTLQLRNFLYGIYYNGSLKNALALESDSADLKLHQNLENNTVLGVDLAFYERLHASNCGDGYFAPGWTVRGQESDNTLAVYKDGLTLHIDRDRHLQAIEQSASVGDAVAILMPKNFVQNGFYMAVGNAGPNTYPQTVRVYFNLTPEGAVVVMASLTRQLNAIDVPFTFKVLYNPSDYDRYDSGVLYFERSNYETVRQVLEKIYKETQSHFRAEIPFFTKFLAPGLALAEEPDRKFGTQESFGTNRCQIIANGLLEARRQDDESQQSRMNFILKQFFLLGIDWQHPYLNSNSEDIYTPLDL
jgi:hypothetical protein